MIILFVMVILILMVGVILLFGEDKLYKRLSELKQKVKLVVYKVFSPVCKVVLYVKNFFGRIIKYAGR